MTLQRAYSLLQVKSAEQVDGKRVIKGIATTPSPDRMGDVVEPKGGQFKLPLPLLWQHDSTQPIGHVTDAKVTKNGIAVSIEVAQTDEAGTLKDRLDEAWQSIKIGLVKGLSIGFRGLEDGVELIKGTNGLLFKSWEWLELSVVTIPANAEATIQTVKALDSGVSANRLKPVATPPLAGKSVKLTQPANEGNTMNFAERIKRLLEEKAAKEKRQLELATKADEAGETLGGAESEEFDTLSTEIEALDVEVKRVDVLQKRAAASAKPVDGSDGENGSASRTGVTLKEKAAELAPGQAFAQYAMLQIASKGDTGKAFRLAERHYGKSNPELVETMKAFDGGFDLRGAMQEKALTKAAVPAGTTTGTTWAAPLVVIERYAGDFLNFLRPQSILGQLEGRMRRIPFNVNIAGQTSKASAGWVGEGKAKPVTKVDYNSINFGWYKAAGIAVLTNELIRFSSPSAELLVRDELAAAVLEAQDLAFIDPANAGIANVKPKSILNGATAIASSGSTDAEITADWEKLWAVGDAANNAYNNPVVIMDGRTARALSLMKNPLGQSTYPGITPTGGTFLGIPVIVSNYVPSDTAGSLLVLVNASDIWFADDGQVTVDASQEASIEMADAPTGASGTPTAATLVSMWQTNSTAYRAERYINWARRRDSGIAYLTGVNYSSAG